MRLRRLARATAFALALTVAAPSALLAQDPVRDHTGIWWNADESGWGLFTVDYGNVLAPTWYTYGEDGQATWFIVTGALPQDDGSYVGDLYSFTGVPFAQLPWDDAQVQGNKIGTARFVFTGEDAVTMSYTVGTVTQTRQLSRFPFPGQDVVCHGSGSSRADASNFTDLWWNPQQSGWGLNLTHVGENLYVTWYAYDEDGEAVWFLAATTRGEDGVFRGPLFRGTTGTPYLQIDGAPIVDGVEDVGVAAFSFADGENGTFTWTVGEVTQSRDVERLVAGANPPVCETVEVPPDGTVQCLPELKVGDFWRDRLSKKNSQGDFVPQHEFTRDRNVIEAEEFNGESLLAVDVASSFAQHITMAKEYFSQDAEARRLHGEESFDPEGALTGSFVYAPPQQMRRRFILGEAVEQTWQVTGTGYSETSSSSHELLGIEPVEIQFGTLDGACKIAASYVTDVTSSDGTLEVEIEGIEWWHPEFGVLRRDFTSTTTTTIGNGAPTTAEGEYRREVLFFEIDGVAFP